MTVEQITLKYRDARSLTGAELFKRREDVVRLHLEHLPVMRIVERTGLSWAAVNTAIKLFNAGGLAALMPVARGRKQGTGRKLSTEQGAEVRRLVSLRRPWYYGLGDSWWSRVTVSKLVEQRLDLSLSDRLLGKYLNDWGIAVPSASKSPKERCISEIQFWLDQNYSRLQETAAVNSADIYWSNRIVTLNDAIWALAKPSSEQLQEAQEVREFTNEPETEWSEEYESESEEYESDDNQYESWEADSPSMPQNTPNRTEKTATRRFQMTSVVNNQGRLVWVILGGPPNEGRQLALLKGLIKKRRKPIILISSDGRVFRNKLINHWIDGERPSIQIFPERSWIK